MVEAGQTVEATAERFQVDAKTVRKWRDRFRAEDDAGLADRWRRPRTCPWATPAAKVDRVCELRQTRRWGAAHIGMRLGLAAATTQRMLVREGLGRLDRGDRATADPVVHYQWDRPGDMIPVDVKKARCDP